MENDNQGNGYALKFLADMEAKYAALGDAIASVRKALNIGALGGLGNSTSESAPSSSMQSSGPVPLPRGAFLGKSIADAVRIYLNAVRARKGNKEIAAALKEGGAVSTGNFDSRINGALFTLKNKGEVLRFDDGWGLAEWYPESYRTRVAEKASAAPAKRPPTTKKKRHQKAKPQAAKDDPLVIPQPGLDKRIEAILQAEPHRAFMPTEISAMVAILPRGASLALNRLLGKKKIVKIQDGGYQYRDNVQEMPKAV
jgi:hypothetical protein